jgi:hypothetical protein
MKDNTSSLHHCCRGDGAGCVSNTFSAEWRSTRPATLPLRNRSSNGVDRSTASERATSVKVKGLPSRQNHWLVTGLRYPFDAWGGDFREVASGPRGEQLEKLGLRPDKRLDAARRAAGLETESGCRRPVPDLFGRQL